MTTGKHSSWVVTMRCEVTKVVVVDGCTEEEARADPWGFAVEEKETDQINWEVQKVEPNE